MNSGESAQIKYIEYMTHPIVTQKATYTIDPLPQATQETQNGKEKKKNKKTAPMYKPDRRGRLRGSRDPRAEAQAHP